MLQRLVYAGLSVPPYFPGRKYQPSRMTSRALTAHIRSQEKPALTFLGQVWVRRYHLSGPGLGQALSPFWARSGSGAITTLGQVWVRRCGVNGSLCEYKAGQWRGAVFKNLTIPEAAVYIFEVCTKATPVPYIY